MKIQIIGEGSNGHESQSWGLAHAIGEIRGVEIAFSRYEIRARGWQRKLLAAYLRMGHFLPKWLLSLTYGAFSFPKNRPDLLICSGGKSVFAAVSISRAYRTPLVFCGDPKPFPVEWFFSILSPVKIESRHPRLLQTEGVLSPINPARIQGAWEKYYGEKPDLDGFTVAVFLGGASRSNRFNRDDWSELAQKINQLGRSGRCRLLITSSRRTGIGVERLLRELIEPSLVHKSVWWSLVGPERVMLPFLDRADVALVTQDSVSMLCEAASAGCPVVALRPQETDLTDFSESVLEGLKSRGAILDISIAELNLDSIESAIRDFSMPKPISEYAEQVVDWLELESNCRVERGRDDRS